MLLFLFACATSPSEEEIDIPSVPLPHQPEVSVFPEQPSAKDDVHCSVLEAPHTTYDYLWVAHNRDAILNGPTLRAQETEWGDSWSCVVTPSNTSGSGESGRTRIAIPHDCSQPAIWEEDLHIQSQDDIDLFCRYNNAVQGDLWLQSAVNLSTLDCLCSVQGDVYISLPSGQTDHHSLLNLQQVAGDVTIFQDGMLSSIEFPSLLSVGDDFQVIASVLESVSAPLLNHIGGEFYIESNEHLTLMFFPQLHSIQSVFSIVQNTRLENITSSVELIGGDVTITDNPALQNFSTETLRIINGALQLQNNFAIEILSFPRLTDLYEGLSVSQMSSLQEISLPNVSVLQEGISIQNNPALEIIDLSSLETVGTSFKVESNDNLHFLDASRLSSISGDAHLRTLPNLQEAFFNPTHISGDLRLQNLSSLPAVNLQNLELVSQSFFFDENLSILDLHLPNLHTLNEDLHIVGNDSLTLISIPPINSIGGSVDISYNISLPDLSLNITTIQQDITIQANSAMTQLLLENVYALYGGINVMSNPLLQHLYLRELTNLGGSAVILDNTRLSEIDFGALLQIQGGLWLQDLPSLENLQGLSNVQHIGEDLRLINISSATDLGLPYLSSIGQDFLLRNNSSLIWLTNYNNLHTISGDLDLKENESLEDIETLMNLWFLSGDLRVLDNVNLSSAQAYQLAEHLLLNQFGGNVVIAGNAEP